MDDEEAGGPVDWSMGLDDVSNRDVGGMKLAADALRLLVVCRESLDMTVSVCRGPRGREACSRRSHRF